MKMAPFDRVADQSSAFRADLKAQGKRRRERLSSLASAPPLRRRNDLLPPLRVEEGIDTLATNEPGHVLDWVMQPISYARHRFPPDIIGHAVWLYLRFTLTYRDVEDLLAERGPAEFTKLLSSRGARASALTGRPDRRLRNLAWPNGRLEPGRLEAVS
jgi:hypothetical protein